MTLQVRLERQRRRWTLTELTKRTGIATSDLSAIERGKRPAFPKYRRLLSAAFGLSEDYLFAPANEEDRANA